MPNLRPVGDMLRDWRQRRRLSQLALSVEANVSTRHLSFVESGRSTPSREMLLHLAEHLEIPLRERNQMLLAAGYAPGYEERALGAPELAAAQQAIALVLDGHEPYPALAIDQRWNLISANRAVAPLLAGCDASLLSGTINVLRLSMHPQGLAPRIQNLAQWWAHLIVRLNRAIELTADVELVKLLEELRSYPRPRPASGQASVDRNEIVVPLRLQTERGTLSFISTTTVFGSPLEVSLSELAIEAFFPADDATAEALRRNAGTVPARARRGESSRAAHVKFDGEERLRRGVGAHAGVVALRVRALAPRELWRALALGAAPPAPLRRASRDAGSFASTGAGVEGRSGSAVD